MRPLILLSVNNSWNILNFRLNVVRRLQAAGYDVAVASPADAHAQGLAAFGIQHIPLPIDSKGLSVSADLRLLVRYRALLRRHRPAALLTWTVKPNIYGSIAARLQGVPAISNVSGLGTAFIRRGLLTIVVSALYRLAFARSATVFFQNPDDRTLFVNKGLVVASRTILLPGSGIDVDRFAPDRSAKRHEGPFTFLLIARLLRDKGVAEFVRAARLVRERSKDVRFLILGTLDADNRTAIGRDELAKWLAEDVFEHLGHTDDVRPFIARADCVVLPSYREGMPRALLEGAALAKPLIATRVPGCVEIAREGVNALLCEARDADSLADAMMRMIDMPEENRRALGAAGRRIVEDEFADRIVGDRYLDAVSAALGSGKS